MGLLLKNLAVKARLLVKKGKLFSKFFSCLACYVCVGLGERELCKCAQVEGCIFYLEYLFTFYT